MKSTITIFLATILTFPLFGQQNLHLQYDILIGGIKVGELNCKKESTDEFTKLSAQSEVKYKFIFNYHTLFDYFAEFNHEGLIFSKFTNTTNAEVREQSITKYQHLSNSYLLQSLDKIENFAHNYFKESMLMAYFGKPKGKHVFSERFLTPIETQFNDMNSVVFKLPDGNVNTYYYDDNGICQEIIIDGKIANIQLSLQSLSEF